uniref:C2H2-type domain-containing protein n=1 Tax=Electrophorus electricus TaxID=8005 RepID=A0A4W4GI21_ELEEL
MTKLESLNSFFCERLIFAAGEIFQAVKDTFSEYQEEIDRSKQENIYLRKMLADVNSLQYRADGDPPQHTRLDSDTSVLQVKLELSTVQQDTNPQEAFNDLSSCPSPCAMTACSEQTRHSYFVQTQDVEESKGDHSVANSAGRVEPLNSQVMCSDGSNSTVIPSESGCENQLVVVKDEPDPQSSSQCVGPWNDFTHLASNLYSTDRLFYCQICGKPFRSDRLLKTHMIVHQKERPYRCELCGKCYSYPHVLKIHLRTHTGERPYHCKFCEKTFNQKGHVKGHERIHTGEKIYSCSACGKRFTWLSQGKEHLRLHRDQVATVIKQ